MSSLARLTIEMIEAMIGRTSENLRLEFKEDLPVHSQRQKEQRQLQTERPRDNWWTGGKIADHGRDKILEEVVAFANAQGGLLILGMEESAELPHVAQALRPLPRVVELEGCFRNFLTSLIEPRLPYVAVRAIQTDESGTGLLLIEAGASRMGPHWHKTTCRPTIRREDSCVLMSMTEIHEMVLRNARRSDEIRGQFVERRESLKQDFKQFLNQRANIQVVSHNPDDRARLWLQQNNSAALALRAQPKN